MVRTLVGLTLVLCLVAFGGTASALPGQTKTVATAPPKTVGKTTFTETETTEDFGTAKAANWKKIKSTKTSETPREGDSTTIDRTIDVRKYANGSKRTTETVHTEETEGLLTGFVRGIKKSKTTTTTYGTVGGKRKKVKKVTEEWEVVEDPGRGVRPVIGGKRVTETFGKGGKKSTDVIDRKTQQWVKAPPTTGKKPSGKKAAPKKAAAKKAAPKKAPLGGQAQGLPTNNPGQRGVVVPELPHVPSGYGGKSPKVPSPKY